MEEINNLLSALEGDDSDEVVQEKLGEIKKHLIQFAQASRNVLDSKQFIDLANS